MKAALKSPKRASRTILLQKRDELVAWAKNEPEALTTSVQSPDAVEFATRTAEQDVTAVTADIRARMLKEIDRALQRVDSGTYGVCEACGVEISAARLKAIPWARYCLTCQELRSRN